MSTEVKRDSWDAANQTDALLALQARVAELTAFVEQVASAGCARIHVDGRCGLCWSCVAYTVLHGERAS